jgi:hypothetical protein
VLAAHSLLCVLSANVPDLLPFRGQQGGALLPGGSMLLAEATTGHKQPDCLVLILCCFYNHFVFVDYSYSILKVSSNANVFSSSFSLQTCYGRTRAGSGTVIFIFLQRCNNCLRAVHT